MTKKMLLATILVAIVISATSALAVDKGISDLVPVNNTPAATQNDTYLTANANKLQEGLVASNEVEPQALYERGDTTLPLAFNGQWEGNGEQTNGSQWTIDISIDSNIQQYIIEYPSLNCGGNLTLISATDTRAEFNERITFGNCIDNGKTVLVKTSENTADFLWYYWNGTQGASGVIGRGSVVGDINGDGNANIQDVVGIINIVLGSPSSLGADINQDSQVNIQDVVALINIILGRG